MDSASPRRLWIHIVTAVTALRIVLVVPIWLALYVPLELGYATALVLFSIAALSDLADGWLARRLDTVTKFGSNLDAIADKILVVGVLAGLAWHDRLDGLALAAFLAIVLREIVVARLRARLMLSGAELTSTLMAKTKTLIQMTGIIVLLATPMNGGIQAIGDMLLLLGAVLGIVSGLQYLRAAPIPVDKTGR